MSTATRQRPTRNTGRALPAVRAVRGLSYDRLSRFRRDEHAPEITIGTDRQNGDSVACAVDMRVPLSDADRFSDLGKSASRFATSERKSWLALLDAIGTGAYTHLFVWLLDRIVRTDEDRATLIKACRANGVVIVQSSTGTVIDPDNPDDVLRATIVGAVAVYEIEKMSKRIRAFKESRREAGLPHGGSRWFGYLDADAETGRARNMEADPIESAIFREMVGRFLGGEALNSLAAWLTREGVPTVNGGKWTGPNLRGLIGAPRYAGLVTHRGEIVGNGKWAALIDEGTHAAVAHKLAAPERKTNTSGNARVYLLAGLAVCDACGEWLRGRPMYAAHGAEYGGRAYACATGRHCHRSVSDVDAVVTAAVIAVLARADYAAALVDNDAGDEHAALTADRAATAARLDALDEQLAAGAITPASYGRVVPKIERDLAALDEQIGAASAAIRTPLAVLDGMTGPSAREAWESADLGRRRELIRLLCSRVALVGAGRSRAPFAPEDVRIDWR